MKSASDAANVIGQRLKSEMKKRGINSVSLANSAGVKTSFIYDIISGKSTNPSTVKLARVADSLGVSLKSLVDSSDTVEPASASTSEYMHIPRLTMEPVAHSPALTTRLQENENQLFSRAWLQRLVPDASALRLVQHTGDAMVPTLLHGDTMLVDTSARLPSPPGLFMVYDGYALTAKRLELLSHLSAPRVRVLADNPQYTTYEKSVDESNIVGRVVWFARAI